MTASGARGASLINTFAKESSRPVSKSTVPVAPDTSGNSARAIQNTDRGTTIAVNAKIPAFAPMLKKPISVNGMSSAVIAVIKPINSLTLASAPVTSGIKRRTATKAMRGTTIAVNARTPTNAPQLPNVPMRVSGINSAVIARSTGNSVFTFASAPEISGMKYRAAANRARGTTIALSASTPLSALVVDLPLTLDKINIAPVKESNSNDNAAVVGRTALGLHSDSNMMMPANANTTPVSTAIVARFRWKVFAPVFRNCVTNINSENIPIRAERLAVATASLAGSINDSAATAAAIRPIATTSTIRVPLTLVTPRQAAAIRATIEDNIATAVTPLARFSIFMKPSIAATSANIPTAAANAMIVTAALLASGPTILVAAIKPTIRALNRTITPIPFARDVSSIPPIMRTTAASINIAVPMARIVLPILTIFGPAKLVARISADINATSPSIPMAALPISSQDILAISLATNTSTPIAIEILKIVPPILAALGPTSFVASISNVMMPIRPNRPTVALPMAPQDILEIDLATMTRSIIATDILSIVAPAAVIVTAVSGVAKNLNAATRPINVRTIPTRPSKPALACSGFIPPIAFTVKATSNSAAPIPSNPLVRPAILIPSLPMLIEALEIRVIAPAKIPSTTAKAAITPTASQTLKSSLPQAYANTTSAPTNIARAIAKFLMAFAVFSKAIERKTLEKLLTTRPTFTRTLPIPSPSSSARLPKPAMPSPILFVARTIPRPITAAKTAPKSICLIQLTIDVNRFLIVVHTLAAPFLIPTTRPSVIKLPILANSLDGDSMPSMSQTYSSNPLAISTAAAQAFLAPSFRPFTRPAIESSEIVSKPRAERNSLNFARIRLPSSTNVCPTTANPLRILEIMPPNILPSDSLKLPVSAVQIFEKTVETIVGILEKKLTIPSAIVLGRFSASFKPTHQSLIPAPISCMYLMAFCMPSDALKAANQSPTAFAPD